MLKVWPVPDSYTKDIPRNGSQGSFWEDRGDRYHCGVDIYAPEKSSVLSIQNGKVIDVGIFTSHDVLNYWNNTHYVIIKSPPNIIYKYAELGEVSVHIGDYVNAGQPIGHVGRVINEDAIDHTTPQYILDLLEEGRTSMLHLEIYQAPVTEVRPYLGGNFLGDIKPFSLIDPALFLNGAKRHPKRDIYRV